MYADLFQNHRDARHSDLAAQLQEARWTVRNVEQRFATILRVAQAIVRASALFPRLWRAGDEATRFA
jgi:RNA polymerase sigma-54 factor